MRHAALPGRLHHPRLQRLSAASIRVKPARLAASLRRPCTSASLPRGRSHRWVAEALLAAMATALFTGVAVAAPQVYRQSPLTSLRQLAAGVVPGAAQPAPPLLIDCP